MGIPESDEIIGQKLPRFYEKHYTTNPISSVNLKYEDRRVIG